MDMTRAGLLKRLTNHLAGEASFDAIDLSQRLDALDEAYAFISEKYQLWTKSSSFGQPSALITDENLPADFQSYTGVAGKYNSLPPALTSDASLPWNGRYPTAFLAISYYAAFRIFEDRGPEMYERATYWKQRFDQLAERLDMEMKRRNQNTLEYLATSQPNSFGHLQRTVFQNLDTAEMSDEDRRRKFPPDIVASAINRAYQDISNKFELNVAKLSAEIAEPVKTLLPANFVSPATTYATLNGFTVQKVAGDIQENMTEDNYNWSGFYDAAPSYRIVTLGTQHWVQFSSLPPVAYPATFVLYYDGATTPMTAPTDLPWGGLYTDAFKLIVYKAMRDLMYGDAKTYNMSRFWQNEYDREEKDFKRILRRMDAGSRVALWGYSRMPFGQPTGFTPIDYPDSRNNE